MWDEHDYENGRNMCWKLFTSFSEPLWSDQQAEPASFERCFSTASTPWCQEAGQASGRSLPAGSSPKAINATPRSAFTVPIREGVLADT